MDNRVVVVGDCAIIECVTKGEIMECIIDAEDLSILESIGTRVSVFYNGLPGKYYARIRVKGKAVLLHRLLKGASPGDLVSFYDGNSLNCRKSNLYIADATTISRTNIVRANRSVGGLIGVTETYKKDGKYMARIIGNDGRKYLGAYDSVADAIKARRQAEQDNWGM